MARKKELMEMGIEPKDWFLVRKIFGKENLAVVGIPQHSWADGVVTQAVARVYAASMLEVPEEMLQVIPESDVPLEEWVATAEKQVL